MFLQHHIGATGQESASLASIVVDSARAPHPLHPKQQTGGSTGGEAGSESLNRPGGSAAPESRSEWRSRLSRTFTVGRPRAFCGIVGPFAVMVDGQTP